ncbi:hypothetical protein [Haloarcula nitratireducens]|uniref:Uncharacterized protein n=1 Tax=Haloarcula nitratireducens TaxID=2487749 RepID=A0AAW4P6G6_9EURY|nr:hypothetical protein [Halomicroarcula nitratireducens]MBX0293321.1 hypothetical protein [Halomicroarcula nitratireducens]
MKYRGEFSSSHPNRDTVPVGLLSLRYGLYVLVGTVCGWYVYGEAVGLSWLRRLGWIAVAVLFGVGGLLAFLGLGPERRTANG